jgi:hypothetical protein
MPHAVRGCDEVCAIRDAQVYVRLGFTPPAPWKTGTTAQRCAKVTSFAGSSMG